MTSHGRYEPKDAIAEGIKGALIMGGAGAFMSAVQNSLAKRNIGAMGFITRTGSSIGLFAAMGGSYMFVKTAMANLREKESSLNPAVGGFVAGAIMGTRFRTMPAVIGYATLVGSIMGIYDFTGGTLRGIYNDVTLDEVSLKETVRKNHRRPIEEAIEALGENRYVQAPGYEQRRAEKLREKYGIEVPPS